MRKAPFIRFCVGVWGHWEARFGSTFAVMLAVVQQVLLEFRDLSKLPKWVKDFPPSIWLAVGAVMLFWASYAAWTDQDRQRETLETRLAKPDIELELPSLWWGGSDQYFAVFAELAVSNPHGPSTALTGWMVELELKDSTKIAGEIPFNPIADIRIPIDKDNAIVLQVNKEVRVRTEIPLPSGGFTSGWLKVVFRELPMGFNPSGCRIKFSCMDVATRQKHELTMPVTKEDHKEGVLFIPGTGEIKRPSENRPTRN